MEKIHPLKGKIQSAEHIRKRMEALKRNGKLKGHVPWNKGKKGVQIAWNRGLKGVIKQSEEAREKHSIAGKKNRPVGTFHHTEETKKIISEKSKLNNPRYWKGKHHNAVRGNKNSNWKGGITSDNRKVRQSVEFRLWREAVFARDNWTCQKTKIKGGKLHPHHIQNFAQYPELRFAIDNGITLSERAHMEFHNKYGRNSNTKEQIEEYLAHGLIAAA